MTRSKRATASDILSRKHGKPIVMLTAYSAPVAEIIDEFCDILLVGDSVAQVVYGYPSTLGATVQMMIEHGRAVVRASKQSLVVVDLPFGSYEESPEQAFRTSAQILEQTGAGAVKLEGGVRMAETIAFLQRRGIPVMAHVGLTPQSIHVLGGYRARGSSNEDFSDIMQDAIAVADAGAFSVVIEAVVEPLARSITAQVDCPTIGIGASAKCDGQVLVVDDVLGVFDRHPRFVRRFADLRNEIRNAAATYAQSVSSGEFPTADELYSPSPPQERHSGR